MAIPVETLRRWRVKLLQPRGWTPKKTPWRLHRRIFSQQEQDEIAVEIKQNAHRWPLSHEISEFGNDSDFRLLGEFYPELHGRQSVFSSSSAFPVTTNSTD
jgi:hypothetical protein